MFFQHLLCGDVGNGNSSSAHSSQDVDCQSKPTSDGKSPGQSYYSLLPDAKHLLYILAGNQAFHAKIFVCRKFANAYSELHAKMVNHLRSLRPKPCTNPNVAHMCKVLEGSKAPPLLRVKVKDKNGQERFETQPERVDDAAIAAWAPIHAGNVCLC